MTERTKFFILFALLLLSLALLYYLNSNVRNILLG
jgi:hypothetical protein